MKFDFSFYIGMLKKNMIKHSGQGNCAIFLLKPLSDLGYVDVSETMVSRWIRHNLAIDEAIRNAAGTETGYNDTLNHFKTNVINDINNVVRNEVIFTLYKSILDDNNIDIRTKNTLKDVYERDDKSEFMTRAFLYVVSIQRGEKISLPLPKGNDDKKMAFSHNEILQEKITNLINSEISYNTGIPDNEMSLISSGDYDLILAAKEDRYAFVVYAEVKAESISDEFSTFVDYMNWLKFTGKATKVELKRVCVFDYRGNKLVEEADILYMGRSLPVPPIRIKEYHNDMCNLIRTQIYIKPPQDFIDLELTDMFGNIIYGLSRFVIEREKTGNICTAYFISDNHEDFVFKLIFIGGEYANKGKMHFSIRIDRKDVTDAKGNVTYYDLLSKIYNAGELKIWQKKDGKRTEFLNVPSFSEKYPEEISSYIKLKEIFQKIVFIENKLNTKLDTTNLSDENITLTLQLYKLLTEGIVVLGQNEYSVPKEYYESYKKKISKLDGVGVFFNAYISDFEIFNQKVEVEQKYKLAIWASKVIVNADSSMVLKAYQSVMYDVCNENVDEEEIKQHYV